MQSDRQNNNDQNESKSGARSTLLQGNKRAAIINSNKRRSVTSGSHCKEVEVDDGFVAAPNTAAGRDQDTSTMLHMQPEDSALFESSYRAPGFG